MEWAPEVEIRNYAIKRETDPRNLLELLRIILTLVMLAGVLIFLSWERNQIINMGYESQRLLEIEEELLRAEKALILEEETLKDPARIDNIARKVLGMFPLRPHQVIPPSYPDLESQTSSALALADSPVSDADLRKLGATN